jgi:hypothetical protein
VSSPDLTDSRGYAVFPHLAQAFPDIFFSGGFGGFEVLFDKMQRQKKIVLCGHGLDIACPGWQHIIGWCAPIVC